MTADRPPARRPPVDASMTLLNEVMHRPLDPGYADAAARRAAEGSPGTPRRRTAGAVALGALAVALGVVTVAAAMDLRAPQPAVLAARQTLEEEITDRQSHADELASRGRELSAEIEQLQDEALGATSGRVLTDIQQEGVLTGSRAVEGPGVVVTLDDGGRGLAPDDDASASLVHDGDLQRVVNALWSGGAEAIAINDQRLTGLSAIRAAGDAILVDLQPLVPPYHVEAVGDGDALRAALVRSGASDYLRLLSTEYGIQSSVTAQSRLEVPGRASPTLYFAQAPGAPVESDPDPAGGGASEEEPTSGDGNGTREERQESVE
ncbi:DUF881 domain-containing protein [Cellulosimicrobium cellulans]|uniref:DUF881 domain-containing protein n=1 Tax=Cellulosimicrobium cellulans TaxID=1710 RepID=UPI000848E418|nr:DUF881 domain-containing protein [Cellulosimicrobium cellulans]